MLNPEDRSTVTMPERNARTSWIGRLGAGIANAWRARSRPAVAVLPEPRRAAAAAVDPLESLARDAEPGHQLALLTEALALLDEFDRRILAMRLASDPYESVAEVLGIGRDTAGPRYALALDRLGERLSWVADHERRGISPPERAALGQVHFLGRTAQDVATLLRLQPEAIRRWIRQSDRSPRPPQGAGP
jgi:DNA-directed RNA polymerase specialized sigma24 family protein